MWALQKSIANLSFLAASQERGGDFAEVLD